MDRKTHGLARRGREVTMYGDNKESIKEKLDDKIAKLNSSRVYKKITPRYDLSWYIKWTSSYFLIIAMMMTSANIFPLTYMLH